MVLDDGSEQRTFTLNRSYYGLYMPRMVWRELENFSSGSVCLVLASAAYDEEDYIRDYDDFLGVREAGDDRRSGRRPARGLRAAATSSRCHRRVLESGGYILGPEVEAFEREFAAYCSPRHAWASPAASTRWSSRCAPSGSGRATR